MHEAVFDQPFDLRVFVDTEYCYSDTENNKRQIVQIAAVLYDVANGKELASFSRQVKPAFTEEISGIAPVRLDETAGDFPEVLAEFAKFCAGYPVWTFENDQGTLEQNCGYFSIEFPLSQPFIRLKALLPSWGVDPAEYSSGTLYKAAGLKMDGDERDALHNARSIAAAVSYFENREIFSTPSV